MVWWKSNCLCAKFREKALDFLEAIPERELDKLCIKGILAKYEIHIENHYLADFVELITKARNTKTSVSRINKLEDSHKWSWKPQKQRIKVAFNSWKKKLQGLKKKGWKEDAPLKFPCSLEKACALLKQWI